MIKFSKLTKSFGVVAVLLLSLCLCAGAASAEVGEGNVIWTIGDASITVDDILAGKTVDIPVYLYYSKGGVGEEIFYSVNVAGDNSLIDGYATVKAAKPSKQPLYDADDENNPLYLNLGNFLSGSVTVDAASVGWNVMRERFVGANSNPTGKYPGINLFNYTVSFTPAAAALTSLPINVSYYWPNFAPWETTGAGNVKVADERVTWRNGTIYIQPPTTVNFTPDPTATMYPAPTLAVDKANISVGKTHFTEFGGANPVPAASLVPTAEGYTFLGYYNETNKDSGTAVMVVNSTGYLVTNAAGYVDENGKWTYTGYPDYNLTLYGAWVLGYSHLIFDENGGSPIAEGNITYGNKTLDDKTAADIIPTRAGYTFLGWNTTDRGSWQQVFASDGTLNASVDGYSNANGNWTNTTSPVNLIADWKANITVFTFNDEVDHGIPYTYIAYNDTEPTPFGSSLIPVRTGSTFNGWALESASGTKLINETGQLISGITGYTDGGKWSNTTVNGTIIPLYANWTVGHSNLTFNFLGGTCTTAEGKIYFGEDVVKDKETGTTEIPAADLVASKEHYIFGGWNVSGTDITVITKDGALISGSALPYVKEGKWNYTTDLVLNASWTPKSTTLTFDEDGGSPAIGDARITYGEAVTNRSAEYLNSTEKYGYILKGWNVTGTEFTLFNESGALMTGDVDIYIKNGKWNASEDTLSTDTLGLKAWWVPKTTVITLDNRSAEPGATEEVTATFDAEMPTTPSLVLPIKEGYEFNGYYNSSDNGVTLDTQYYTDDGDSAHIWNIEAETYTLYANWTGIPITLDLNPNNGSAAYSGTVIFGETSASTTGTFSPTKPTFKADEWREADTGIALIKPDGNLVSGNVPPYVKDGKWDNLTDPVSLTAHYLPDLEYAGLEGKAAVVEDSDGNYIITLTGDVTGPVTIPDTWENTTLDLNGHTIKGADGTTAEPDGKPGLIMTSESGSGTNLTIKGSGKIIGGNGADGSPAGKGGSGIISETTAAETKLSVDSPSIIKGGNGGNSNDPSNPGGAGGDGISGTVPAGIEINGGDVSGGTGGNGANGSGDTAGSAGGAGGAGISATGETTINSGNVSGGNGGNGGSSENGEAGAGGAGGDGSTTSPTTVNGGDVSGGTGGNGGNSTGNGTGGAGGAGGDGSSGSPTTVNNGDVSGGTGGNGGNSGSGEAGDGGDGGMGASQSPVIINDGDVSGGAGGNGGNSDSGEAGDGGNGGIGASGESTAVSVTSPGSVSGGNGGNGGNSGNGVAGNGGNGADSITPIANIDGTGTDTPGNGGNGGNTNSGTPGEAGDGGQNHAGERGSSGNAGGIIPISKPTHTSSSRSDGYSVWLQSSPAHYVNFTMMGHGTQIVNQTVAHGSAAVEPMPAPTAKDAYFGGWYTDTDCTFKYDFTTPVTSTVTLYAKWTNMPTAGQVPAQTPASPVPFAGILAGLGAAAFIFTLRRK